MLRISSLVFLFAMVMRTMGTDPSKKVLLSVYYESKCPDSKNFIADQLLPAMELLGDYVDLYLIPFGKARSIHGKNLRFQCQHGPTECMGNMVQSCTIDQMMGRASDLQIVQYVDCEMKTLAGTTKDMTCVQQAGLDAGLVEECVSSKKGVELQWQHEKETKSLNPRFIPSVTVNGKFTQKFQDLAMRDLIRGLCKFLKDEPPCAQRYNDLDNDSALE